MTLPRTTTIQIELEVRDQLRERGRMGESYNDVIKRLLAANRPVEGGGAFKRAPIGPPTGRPWIPMQDRK